jgi:hypothetical protein
VLKAAVLAADPAVLARLSSRGQVTVFAPTDQAFFDLLGERGLDGLDDIDQATLTQVLLYHVVPGARTAKSVLPAPRLRTLQGGFLQQARSRPDRQQRSDAYDRRRRHPRHQWRGARHQPGGAAVTAASPAGIGLSRGGPGAADGLGSAWRRDTQEPDDHESPSRPGSRCSPAVSITRWMPGARRWQPTPRRQIRQR